MERKQLELLPPRLRRVRDNNYNQPLENWHPDNTQRK